MLYTMILHWIWENLARLMTWHSDETRPRCRLNLSIRCYADQRGTNVLLKAALCKAFQLLHV